MSSLRKQKIEVTRHQTNLKYLSYDFYFFFSILFSSNPHIYTWNIANHGQLGLCIDIQLIKQIWSRRVIYISSNIVNFENRKLVEWCWEHCLEFNLFIFCIYCNKEQKIAIQQLMSKKLAIMRQFAMKKWYLRGGLTDCAHVQCIDTYI